MFTSEEIERMREALSQAHHAARLLMTPMGSMERYAQLTDAHASMQRTALRALAQRDPQVTLADALAELDRITNAQIDAFTP